MEKNEYTNMIDDNSLSKSDIAMMEISNEYLKSIGIKTRLKERLTDRYEYIGSERVNIPKVMKTCFSFYEIRIWGARDQEGSPALKLEHRWDHVGGSQNGYDYFLYYERGEWKSS